MIRSFLRLIPSHGVYNIPWFGKTRIGNKVRYFGHRLS
ncbi:hypothetical protein JMJ77_0012719 [Colletotrichum scovillei]|uniref:Uncharacterized protein n=1 Tax=Colletotrichum scovillei TaxID=1209932 RepID=A0A9P7R7G0_9PEZI|nr:hypothetical protein JMJ77_0012719 [Colletotrichum scovillei]KAG7069000.1 hypothetical protein JMJ76_0002680 [Colletotrichum scovillei]KAG7072952.1 hypothetical protein JMJ78_0013937 [Colletotrichum scovillei]